MRNQTFPVQRLVYLQVFGQLRRPIMLKSSPEQHTLRLLRLLPLPEEAAGGGELIVPLAQFRRTGWSAASPVDIPTAARIRWGHIGPIGIPAEGDAAGTLTLRQFDFLK